MQLALCEAGLDPSQVNYINAHATSTPLGDRAEVKAITRLLGQASGRYPTFVGSNKGAIGHLLGAAGAVECAFTLLALRYQRIPPTCNFTNFDDELQQQAGKLISVSSQVQEGPEMRVALKNSFGFGGTNASLCLAVYDASSRCFV